MPTTSQIRELPSYYRVTIPADYLDILGHMNVRWYSAIIDDATWRFFASFGASQDYFMETQCGIFALKQFIQYRAEVREGETIAVHSRLVNVTEKRAHFIHFMLNETTDTLAATSEALGTHVDLTVRRSAPFASVIREQMAGVYAQHQALIWDAPLSGAISV